MTADFSKVHGFEKEVVLFFLRQYLSIRLEEQSKTMKRTGIRYFGRDMNQPPSECMSDT
jgi:hypothetical protein